MEFINKLSVGFALQVIGDKNLGLPVPLWCGYLGVEACCKIPCSLQNAETLL